MPLVFWNMFKPVTKYFRPVAEVFLTQLTYSIIFVIF